MIVHEGKKWVLYTRDGSKLLGTHDTREEAMIQEAAIHARQAAVAGAKAGRRANQRRQKRVSK